MACQSFSVSLSLPEKKQKKPLNCQKEVFIASELPSFGFTVSLLCMNKMIFKKSATEFRCC